MKHTHLFQIYRTIIILSCSYFITLTADAGVYKWTDKEGQVHYTQQEPADADSQRMKNVKSASKKQKYEADDAEQASNKKSADDADNESNEKSPNAEAEKKDNKKLNIPQQEKRRLCKQARKIYSKFSSGRRIRTIQQDGSYHYLKENERLRRLSEAHVAKKKYCR